MIEPKDVVVRLLRRRPYWPDGKPEIILEGEVRQFGKLIFDFGDGSVDYTIYIYDRDHILETAQTAIDNFQQLFVEITESMAGRDAACTTNIQEHITSHFHWDFRTTTA